MGVYSSECRGKVQHDSEKEARKAAKIQHKKVGIPMGFYQCSHCFFWHVGTYRSPEQIRRRIEKGSPKVKRAKTPYL